MPEKIITKEALSYFKGKYDDQMDDVLAGKQATLVSGENIKTINNESILGPGNINISGGGGTAPYEVQDYQLDTSEETFECSDADAEYIFENNPTAISLGGTIAVARDFTDDESKNDYSRSYSFFEFPDDDQLIVYELGLYYDGSEYSFDLKPTDPIGGGGSGLTKVVIDATQFDQSTGLPTDAQLNDILDSKYDVVEIINAPGISNESFYLDTYNTYNNQIVARYVCRTSTDNDENSLVAFEITRQNGSNSPSLNILMPDFSVVKANESIPSGTGSTPLQTLKVGGNYYTVSNGGGGGEDKVYPIAITANPGVGDTLLAAAQNLTMADMPDAPGYTYAPFTLESDINYTEPYDAVLVEFHAGHQYLLPLVQADSGTALYGEVDGTGMPVFNNYPAAVVFLLNSGSLSSVMLVSDVADGTLVATSLHGYVFSETTFSLNANGVTTSDIDTAVAAGKVPVAVVDWSHKDYKSWCPAEVRYDESNRAYYKFGGAYKDKEFTITNDGSSWSLAWITSAVKDVELLADIDNANNKVYFRSLNDMRAMQAGMPMVTLKLYDHATHDFSGYLGLTLSAQINNGASTYYSSTQVAEDGSGTAYITTLRVDKTDTLPGGSSIFKAQTAAHS